MILDRIVERKKQEVEALSHITVQRRPDRSFLEALKKPKRKGAVIAEVKKASPSKGVFTEQFDPVDIARSYEEAGADALSVLTDRDFFQGDPAYIRRIKEAVSLPVLRKDFLIDKKQIDESVELGADAVLLIAAILTPETLGHFFRYAKSLGLDVLVEVHSKEELEAVINECEPDLLGINNRNLKTFETSLIKTKEVAASVPDGSLLISESGIHTSEDAAQVLSYGARGMLIGESLMLAIDKREKLNDLFKGAAKGEA
ncbi:indole-3-glycerol phosphate synthase TrpC [Alteribacter keqinensis]|uniref:indole-3-glycerol phosphate synthase TrpC n=1 Tax=Alteribacter keqinensis TaxID=2483800 RepID=UPI0020183DED|nr:indole-3-glycerol phosphate synthase TrpC [Alteribacter keqinensis]